MTAPDLTGRIASRLSAPHLAGRKDLPSLPAGSDLQELVGWAAAALGCGDDEGSCGISVDRGRGVIETIATTDDLLIRLDWLQHELQQGPRVGLAGDAESVLSADLAGDGRWPEFGPLCAAVIGVHSLLSVRIPTIDGSRAVLNFCACRPGVFGEEDVDLATRLAREVAVLGLPGAEDRDDDGGDAAPGQDSVLAKALGILMARYRLDAADAFFMLHKASDDLGWTLVELATKVLLSGRLPARRISEARIERSSRHTAAS